MKDYKILAINPGSGSLKIALFNNEDLIFGESIYYKDSFKEKNYDSENEIESKVQLVIDTLDKHGILLSSIDAFSGRAGGLTSMEGGVYLVNDLMLKHAKEGYSMKHASNLGIQIADMLAKQCGKIAYTVNPVTVDELQAVAKITGIKGIYKQSIFHALNQKEIAHQYAKSIEKKYEDLNLIVVHLGSGITIGAHKHGKVIDVNNALRGDGPFTTSRTGSTFAQDIIDMCFSGQYSKEDMVNLITRKGGLTSLLGTNDVLEVLNNIENGDEKSKVVLDTMLYQISKQIAAVSINFGNNLDGIILTGAMAKSNYITDTISSYVSFIGNVIIRPGELELEALSNGVLRVLQGEENPKKYSGKEVDIKIRSLIES